MTNSFDESPKPLQEKDFIQEKYTKDPFPFWIWLAVIAAFVILIWGSKTWYNNQMHTSTASNPFLQVTNRDMSLFLWQHPEYMRANVRSKTGYLPAFQYFDHVGPEPELADQFVVAPPELLFQYHIWDLLLRNEFSSTPIGLKDFREFLDYSKEWLPEYWPASPKGYNSFVSDLMNNKITTPDLQLLPPSTLPQEVRLAFQGWMNYYKEGDLINAVTPTFSQMNAFLAAHPHYARPFWRNILIQSTPDYLKALSAYQLDPEAKLPAEEMAPFLKAAYFNFHKTQNHKFQIQVQ